MTSHIAHSDRVGWLTVMALALGLSACDRNTAPPQQPTTHVIEFTRVEPGVAASDGGTQANPVAMPYGAAAPMTLSASETPVVNATPARASPSLALSATEMAFITQANEAGMFDMRIGQLGRERASNEAVRSYAVMLVTDQVAFNSGLQQLARQLGVPLPSALSEPKQQILDGLARTGLQEFDLQFVQAVGVRGHAATIELFERTGRETRDPLVRAFVLNTLPMLRAHLGVAERLPIKG